MNDAIGSTNEKIYLLSDILVKLNKLVELMNDVNNNFNIISENNQKIESFTDMWLPFYSQLTQQQEINE